jgi:RimJ/RimL family protein N-acetyltransferase
VRPIALRTARLVLDEPKPADADLVTAYCQDPLFERYLTTPWPYSRADADAFLGEFVPESWAIGSELTWAVRSSDGGPLLGMISVRPSDQASGAWELGYWMGSAHRGGGIMSEAAVAVSEWALAGGIRGITSLHWRAVEGNVASAKVARAAGFRMTRPDDPTVPARGGGTLPAWHAVRGRTTDPLAAASWTGVLEPR